MIQGARTGRTASPSSPTIRKQPIGSVELRTNRAPAMTAPRAIGNLRGRRGCRQAVCPGSGLVEQCPNLPDRLRLRMRLADELHARAEAAVSDGAPGAARGQQAWLYDDDDGLRSRHRPAIRREPALLARRRSRLLVDRTSRAAFRDTAPSAPRLVGFDHAGPLSRLAAQERPDGGLPHRSIDARATGARVMTCR